jgi:hypothetical protein
MGYVFGFRLIDRRLQDSKLDSSVLFGYELNLSTGVYSTDPRLQYLSIELMQHLSHEPPYHRACAP